MQAGLESVPSGCGMPMPKARCATFAKSFKPACVLRAVMKPLNEASKKCFKALGMH